MWIKEDGAPTHIMRQVADFLVALKNNVGLVEWDLLQGLQDDHNQLNSNFPYGLSTKSLYRTSILLTRLQHHS